MHETKVYEISLLSISGCIPGGVDQSYLSELMVYGMTLTLLDFSIYGEDSCIMKFSWIMSFVGYIFVGENLVRSHKVWQSDEIIPLLHLFIVAI